MEPRPTLCKKKTKRRQPVSRILYCLRFTTHTASIIYLAPASRQESALPTLLNRRTEVQ
jgi:hypothetical protein